MADMVVTMRSGVVGPEIVRGVEYYYSKDDCLWLEDDEERPLLIVPLDFLAHVRTVPDD